MSQARDCFDQAERWMRKQPKNLPTQWAEELKVFRGEAQQCLESTSRK